VRDVVVVAGGTIGGVATPEVWEWDGDSWSFAFDLDAPVSAAHAAYDFARGAVVVAGHDAAATLLIAESAATLTTPSPLGDGVAVAGPDGVVFVAGSDTFVLESGGWRALDPLPLSAAGGLAWLDDQVVTVVVPDLVEDSDARFRLVEGAWNTVEPLPIGDRAGAMAASSSDTLASVAVIFGGEAVDGAATFVVDGDVAVPLSPLPLFPDSPAVRDVAQAAFDPGDVDDPAGLHADTGSATCNAVLRVTEEVVVYLGNTLPGLLVDGDDDHRAFLVGDTGFVLEFDADGSGEFVSRIVNTDAVAGASVAGGRAARDGADVVLVTAAGATFVLHDDVWTAFGGPVPVPNAGFGLAAARPADARVVALFPDVEGHTWTFDGAAWSDHGAIGPSRRSSVSMAADLDAGAAVAFGGLLDGGAATAEAWVFDGSDWTAVDDVGPGARAAVGLAFDAARHRTVAVGGLFSNDEIWAWNSGAADIAGLRFDIDVGAAQVGDAVITNLDIERAPFEGQLPFLIWTAGRYATLTDVPLQQVLTGSAPTVHIVVPARGAVTVDQFEATFSFRSR
jgi:hypothetical protein